MKFTQLIEQGRARWSQWVRPVHKGYRIKCCRCSLVHDMEFRIVKGNVEFRARRRKKKP